MRHDQAVDRLIVAGKKLDLAVVAEAFVASLGGAPLRYRTALVSYALASHLPRHELEPYAKGRKPTCRICGSPRSEAFDVAEEEASIADCGQVVPGEVLPAMADLETFGKLPPVKATDAGWAVLSAMLAVIAASPGPSRNGAIEKALAAARIPAKANKYDRRFILETLSQIGALEVPGRPGLLRAFTPYVKRDERPGSQVEVCAPLAWWKRADGIQVDALRRVFPDPRLKIPR